MPASVSITVCGQDCSPTEISAEELDLLSLMFSHAASALRENKHGVIEAKGGDEEQVGAVDLDQGEGHEFDEGDEERVGDGLPVIKTLTMADVKIDQVEDTTDAEDEEDDTAGGDDYPASQRRAPVKRTPAAHTGNSNLRKQVKKNVPKKAAKKAAKKTSRR